jgi:hypothetical protein
MKITYTGLSITIIAIHAGLGGNTISGRRDGQLIRCGRVIWSWRDRNAMLK